MKKISLILAVVSILAFILSSCSGGGKEPDASTTEDVVTTESPTTAAVTTQNVSHPQEPKDPEPIYVGMKYSEYQEACKKMKNSYKAFFELFGCAYWIDENGNNVIAEVKDVDGEAKVVSIDRYFPTFPTPETFEQIGSSENMTVQKLVELAGVPIGLGPTSGVITVLYRDIYLNDYLLRLHEDHIEVSPHTSVAKNAYDRLVTTLCNKYSFSDFELHRILLQETDDGKYEVCMQGAHGAEKTVFTKSLAISKNQYDRYSDYRNVKNGILYNTVATDEYSELYYDVPANIFGIIADLIIDE